MGWRRKWQPTLVFLPGKSHGQWSLVGCSLWSRKELDMTEAIKHKVKEVHIKYSLRCFKCIKEYLEFV